MATPQDMLTACEAAILKRLNGDSYESYEALGKMFKGTSLKDLYELRTKLQREINAAAGLSFGLAETFDR